MPSTPFRPTLKIDDTPPFGEIALAPDALAAHPDGVLAQLMTDALRHENPDSDAETLMHLRRRFPQTSLSACVAALGALMRR